MIRGRWRAIALVGVLVASVAGCSQDSSDDEKRVEYTVVPSAEPPPSDTGPDSSVETERQQCPSSGGRAIAVPVPTAWQTDVEDVDNCKWVSDDASITLTYGELPEDDAEAWKAVLNQHQTAEFTDKIPGYAIDRYTANAGGGPLWHYRYIDSTADGGVYLDSLNLYRKGWQITYEAESTSYNSYFAEDLIDQASVT